MGYDKVYLDYKKKIKNMCWDSAVELSRKIGLLEDDEKLLLCVNRNMSKVATCMELGIADSTYTKNLGRIINKIEDYEKRRD